MKINIRGVSVNYIQYGEGKKDILLLHGWGQNIEMMKFIGDAFSDRFRITILDFPGFGESEEPSVPWQIQDYSLLIEELVNRVNIKKPIIMGHSFGGRVAIHYSSHHPIEKLILFGSPCVRLQKSLPLSTRILKKLKKLPGMNEFGERMKNYIGSRDYKAASPIMRQTLVYVVNEDLSEFAKKIEEPTLLIWGEQDTEAPIEEAKILENLLYDGALIVLPGTHYAYIENLSRVVTIINNFIS
ncbi:MAG: alpha/beta hydrolase [bacterium]|nr:alpha/beta hydrolase [Mycoplasmatota bacterium]MDD6757751.1 alpha/beta hydrolase [bacterium]MDY2907720.1 alpha/beta hydrolase [Candidatus Faecimonas sp.]